MPERPRVRPPQPLSLRSPARAADELIRAARRGNPAMSSVVELHAGQLNRAQLLAVMGLLFEHMSTLYQHDA